MDESTRETISYYDESAGRFVAETAGAGMGALQPKFASMLPAGGGSSTSVAAAGATRSRS